MRIFLTSFALLYCITLASAQSDTSPGRNVKVVIETEILPFDPVSGVKSRQTVIVDVPGKKASQEWTTGTTYGIPSARDKFELDTTHFTGTGGSFHVTGETASGVRVMPNINYDFTVEVSTNGSARLIYGCHDGYPAYKITVDGRELYKFEHESVRLDRLYGECSVQVGARSLPPSR